MEYFKEDKVKHALYKAEIKNLSQSHGVTHKEKHYDALASIKVRLEKRFRDEPPSCHEEAQYQVAQTFLELIHEARDAGDWEAFGTLHILVGHNQLDPNFF